MDLGDFSVPARSAPRHPTPQADEAIRRRMTRAKQKSYWWRYLAPAACFTINPMRAVVPLLVAVIAASPAACGPESYHRGGDGGGAGGGGAGGTGGAHELDAGDDGPASGDAADSGEGNDVPASDAGSDADGPPTDAGATFTCPTTINGILETTDRTQVGRHSRFAPISICGAPKAYPDNAADPTKPHVFDVYRFVNPTAATVCFNFTLTYATTDAGPGNDRYMVAYTVFNPADIMSGYLGDVGTLTPPHMMGITVAAGASIDVVVYAVNAANDPFPYVGPYTLSCAAP
jgi:hypothetical protein